MLQRSVLCLSASLCDLPVLCLSVSPGTQEFELRFRALYFVSQLVGNFAACLCVICAFVCLCACTLRICLSSATRLCAVCMVVSTPFFVCLVCPRSQGPGLEKFQRSVACLSACRYYCLICVYAYSTRREEQSLTWGSNHDEKPETRMTANVLKQGSNT